MGPSPTEGDEVAAEIDQALSRTIANQRAKVLRLAREAVPNLGPDDVLNPHDHPELRAHPFFEYEDGVLAGLVSAQIVARATHRQRKSGP